MVKYLYIYIYMVWYICIDVHIYIYICIYICTCIYTISVYTNIYIYYIHPQTYIHTYIHTINTHTYTYIHVHTHTCQYTGMCTVDQHTCAQLTRRSTPLGSRQWAQCQHRENRQLRECNTATAETTSADSCCELYMVAELCLTRGISKQQQ